MEHMKNLTTRCFINTTPFCSVCVCVCAHPYMRRVSVHVSPSVFVCVCACVLVCHTDSESHLTVSVNVHTLAPQAALLHHITFHTYVSHVTACWPPSLGPNVCFSVRHFRVWVPVFLFVIHVFLQQPVGKNSSKTGCRLNERRCVHLRDGCVRRSTWDRTLLQPPHFSFLAELLGSHAD